MSKHPEDFIQFKTDHNEILRCVTNGNGNGNLLLI